MTASRTCTTRVRTGCLTCKRRRKKCDEGRPACGNCVSSKRTCKGYTDPFRVQSQGAIGAEVREAGSRVRLLPAIGSSTSQLDLRHFDTFRHLSARLLGDLDAALIQEVLQRSWSQQSIWHALLALSVQLESFTKSRCESEGDASNELYSHWHHGQSIRCIQQCLKDELRTEKRVEMLIAILLIISFDLLQGNGIVALIHLEGALSALHALDTATIPKSKDHRIMKTLEVIFTKLDVQSLAYVGSRVPARSISDFDVHHLPTDRNFAADRTIPVLHVTALRDSFVLLDYRGYQAMRCNRLDDAAYSHDIYAGVSDDRAVARKSILEDFQRWFQFFWPVLETVLSDINEADPQYYQISKQCRLLHIRYLIMTMRLANQGPSRETFFDTFENSFGEIIRHTEAILEGSGPRLLFTMDMELIEPLYFVAMKCREPTKRAGALNLLQSCTQEGVWDGPLMAAIARYAVSVEVALFEVEFPSGHAHSADDECSSSVAERMWNHRDAVNAEMCRVSSTALISLDWKQRTALVECGHSRGKVRAMCTAPILP